MCTFQTNKAPGSCATPRKDTALATDIVVSNMEWFGQYILWFIIDQLILVHNFRIKLPSWSALVMSIFWVNAFQSWAAQKTACWWKWKYAREPASYIKWDEIFKLNPNYQKFHPAWCRQTVEGRRLLLAQKTGSSWKLGRGIPGRWRIWPIWNLGWPLAAFPQRRCYGCHAGGFEVAWFPSASALAS